MNALSSLPSSSASSIPSASGQDRGLQAQMALGGWPLPLGYELKDGKLVVIEGEAERVQFDASV